MLDRVPVLLAAGGAPWEASALTLLGQGGCVVLKRCVDLTDLLASAHTGQAAIALVSGSLPGLDADAVVQLLRSDVRCVAVGSEPEALQRLGVVAVLDPAELTALPEVVSSAGSRPLVEDPAPAAPPPAGAGTGSVVAVHGPAGAPGRTTVAIGLAAEHAHRGSPSLLVDADPHGGAVAQHLGLLDEVSGVLAAARLANAGSLDATGFAGCRRRLSDGLEVLTGLPRPDRWVEVRTGSLSSVLDLAREFADTVVDTGFSLEEDVDSGRRVSRNQLTLDAIAASDQVVVVGSAEPTGLARLVRTLVELRDGTDAPVTVVVNRMRDSLGWGPRDIVGMVEGYIRPRGVHFLPEDRPGTDKALVAGKALVELGDSDLRRSMADLHDSVFLGRPAQMPPISR